MGGIIVYGFLLAALICGGGILLIMWLNSKDSTIDDRTYEQSFDPTRLVSRYRVNEITDEDTFDPDRELGRYAEHRFNKQKKTDEEDYSLDERDPSEESSDEPKPNEAPRDEAPPEKKDDGSKM